MPRKSPTGNMPRFVAWSTRNLLETHRDRMRVLAALRDHRGQVSSMEAILNEALEIGLARLEEDHPGLKKAKRA